MPTSTKDTLKIVIKQKWFDEILAKKKVTEYRAVIPYWQSRLYDKNNKKRHYDLIEFINGYQTDARRLVTGYEGFKKRGDEFLIGIGKIKKKINTL